MEPDENKECSEQQSDKIMETDVETDIHGNNNNLDRQTSSKSGEQQLSTFEIRLNFFRDEGFNEVREMKVNRTLATSGYNTQTET